MNTEEIPYFEDKESALRPDLPIVERDTINAILYNPKTNEYLCLDWEKFNWKTFIIGGVEDGENPVVAAQREIKEETGYSNLKFITEIGKARSGYFAAHKNENRISNAAGLLFELITEEKEAVDSSETVNHICRWIPEKEVGDFINLDSQRYFWEMMKKVKKI